MGYLRLAEETYGQL